ncbi:hypothetical protein HOK00_07825 [bacterium]|nr:hypothetical protein [bacterium]
MITDNEFKELSKYIYDNIGIHLPEGKKPLVQTRLNKRLKSLKLKNYTDYINYLKSPNSSEELIMLTNEISTNVTHFFRENNHFDFLKKYIYDNKNKKEIKIWSSACSSGEEPYSIAIHFFEVIKKNNLKVDFKILASDISEEILEKASNGQYTFEDVKNMPKDLLLRYFDEKQEGIYQIKSFVKDKIIFREFNLVYGDYSKIKDFTFDLIFCRNVMIYFDPETKTNVSNKLINKVKREGVFFIGQTESLVNKCNDIKCLAPSIYLKN